MKVSRDERKERIMLGALKVFVEKGIDKTSMEDLARSLGKTKSYFYFYFKSKEDLILNLFLYIKRKALDEIREELLKVRSPVEKLEVWIREHYRQVRKNPDFLRFVYMFVYSETAKRLNVERGLEKHQEYFDILTDIIKEGQERGLFRKGPPKLFVHAIRGTIYGSMRYIFERDARPEDMAEVEDAVVGVLLHGILSKGQP